MKTSKTPGNTIPRTPEQKLFEEASLEVQEELSSTGIISRQYPITRELIASIEARIKLRELTKESWYEWTGVLAGALASATVSFFCPGVGLIGAGFTVGMIISHIGKEESRSIAYEEIFKQQKAMTQVYQEQVQTLKAQYNERLLASCFVSK